MIWQIIIFKKSIGRLKKLLTESKDEATELGAIKGIAGKFPWLK